MQKSCFLRLALVAGFVVMAHADVTCSAVLQVPGQHATIGKALSASSSGDTVKVAAGVYFEHITL